ncbi:MAG: beta-galactosidase [Bifidobacterium thermophilum]|nr:beta-galactosidase [Bifidobacterium thermophilum]
MRRTFQWPAVLNPAAPSQDPHGNETESNGKHPTPAAASRRNRIIFGGDYNPDQWPQTVWDDDIRLMREAHVNTVALAIFSWDRIQPEEHRWDFDWLDLIIDKLGHAGIAVDLASATATAPLWLYEAHPEVLPRDKYGHVVGPGARQSWSPNSPVFREYALTMCRKLAERYGRNPYVTSWHMGNEYGWNNREDYSDDAQRAFRDWCRRTYGSIDALNAAWGTTFWGQEIHDFDQVLIPRYMGADAMVNPGQQLDFERFGNDALLDFYKAERDAIAEICPDKPFTTNFMISTDQCAMDYAQWAHEVDFVSNDHYFHEGALHLDELSCSDALVDSLALNHPWYVMEHSTSAVQWKPLNARKRKGELTRDALAHIAMGADAINFFQWRASAFGAEAFHSAMLPHAGEDTALFREVCALGKTLDRLADTGLAGSRLQRSDTAILFDAQSQWATRSQTLPSRKLDHWHDVRDWYQAFLDAGTRADVIPLSYDWSGYSTIVLPTVLVLSDADTRRIADFAQAGGTVIIGYATGLVDENFHVGLGGYPGAGKGLLRSMLGIRGEEFNIIGPQADGDADAIMLAETGSIPEAACEQTNGRATATTRLWQNVITVTDPHVHTLAVYHGEAADDWDLDGLPAVTRNQVGNGLAYYVGCDLREQDLTAFIRLNLAPTNGCLAPEVLHTTRVKDTVTFDFYFARDKQGADIRQVNGEPIVMFRAAPGSEEDSYTLHRNGVLITRTNHPVSGSKE